MLRNGLAVLSAILLALPAAAAQQREEIRLWHSLTGVQAWELEQLASRFNSAQRDFRLVVSYQPGAPAEGRDGPNLVLLPDTATADLLARKDAVRPAWQVLAESGRQHDARYVPGVAGYFSDERGRLLALPLAAATPVLYYNRDALRRARVDPARVPRNWYEMPDVLEALVASGSACPFTTALPSWILLENMSAWHNEEFATHDNGMDGAGDAQLSFNGRLIVRWISMLSSWNKSGYFSYSGRGEEAEARFASGECALLTASSASYWRLRVQARFGMGVAHLPYYDDIPGAPQNTLTGGAALWVLGGKDDYRGAARFLAWAMRPDVQAEWHQRTGYAPVSLAAYELSRRQGFYERHPALDIAVGQLLTRNPTAHTRGIRLAGMRTIRAIIDEELEAVWGGKKTPLDAVNNAVERGNVLLIRTARPQ